MPSQPADEGGLPDGPRSATTLHPSFGHLLPQAETAGRARYGRLLRDLTLYGACSAAALGVDWLTLTLLVRQGIPPLAAAAIGFSFGMAVTYLASVRLVYADRRRGSQAREAASFVLVGIAGLGLNEVLIWGFCAGFGLAAPIAKAPTAGLVFLFNFAVRRALVFAAPAR